MPEITHFLKDYLLGPAHIGFVVEDLSQAISEACLLYGLKSSDVDFQPHEGEDAATRFAFFDVAGLSFEYIQPCSETFKKQLFAVPSGAGGINHIAWRVSNIDKAIALLADQGVYPGYVTPGGVITIGAKKMVYLNPVTTGGSLIELIQYPDSDAIP